MFPSITSCLLVLTLSLPVSVVRGQTLSEVIANNTELSSLNAAIKAANLSIADFFESDKVTVFAPNNAAFTKLGSTLSDLLLPQYIAHLNSVLLMHAIGSEALESTDLKDGAQYIAANMDPLNISISSGNVSIVSPNSTATVITPDINTTEGVVHIIDAVLLPKFVSQGLLDLTNTVDGYSTILKLLDSTGLKTLVTDDLKATVFAPTDEAFNSLPAGALDYYLNSTAAATNLLSGHVIAGNIVPTQLMTPGLLSVKSPEGFPFYITVENGIYKVNNATIVQPNTLAINGIIHGISTVLSVPGAEYPPKTPVSPMAPTGGPPTPVAAPTSSSFTSVSVSGMYVTFMVAFFVATTMMM